MAHAANADSDRRVAAEPASTSTSTITTAVCATTNAWPAKSAGLEAAARGSHVEFELTLERTPWRFALQGASTGVWTPLVSISGVRTEARPTKRWVLSARFRPTRALPIDRLRVSSNV